jgi:hypothetical protein
MNHLKTLTGLYRVWTPLKNIFFVSVRNQKKGTIAGHSFNIGPYIGK